MKERTYVCCDLKSFYASVECVERGLDPIDHQPGGGQTSAAPRNDMPGCLPLSESLWDLWPGAALRGGTAGGGGERQSEVERPRPSVHRLLLA